MLGFSSFRSWPKRVPLVSYALGGQLSGALAGGGIGGLLARSDISNLQSPDAHYHADGNGNVTCLIAVNQLVAARYHYDPYGNTLSASGPLAGANLYRFSSKEWHPASGLVYYLYRFYDGSLQRWMNRDPIAEHGGLNFHQYVRNAPNNNYDPWGEQSVTVPSDEGRLCPTNVCSADANSCQAGTVICGNNLPCYPVPPKPIGSRPPTCRGHEGEMRETGCSTMKCPCTQEEVRCIAFERCELKQLWLTANSGPVTDYFWVPHQRCGKCPEGSYGNF